MLRITELDKDSVVCTDACKEGINEFLMQEGKIVCYESRKLNKHEEN